jgi:hypothetical protein
MNISRSFAAVVSLFLLVLPTRADLFEVSIATVTYSLNNEGRIKFHPGDAKEFIDLAAQNSSLDPKKLVLAYDTVADALEVVRKSDGTIILPVMSFGGGLQIETASEEHVYRQAFITLSGTDVPSGSVAGPIHATFDGQGNITSYHWDGEFQYNIPGDPDTLNRIVRGHFEVKRDVHNKALP